MIYEVNIYLKAVNLAIWHKAIAEFDSAANYTKV